MISKRTNAVDTTVTDNIMSALVAPKMISFAGGAPASDCLPLDEFRTVVAELMKKPDPRWFQYGNAFGFADFTETLTDYMKRFGIENAKRSQIMVNNGSSQSIQLAFDAFTDEGDTILVEAPTFLAVLDLAAKYNVNAVGVKSGYDGMDIEDLEAKIVQHKPAFVYVVPTFSNPTGKTLCVEKRKAIAELAQRYGCLVIEDEAYRDLRYDGTPMPAIKAFDDSGNVLFFNSFSKTVMPGIRLGYVFGDEALVKAMSVGKTTTDVNTNVLTQMAVREMIVNGMLENHLKRVIPVYKEKRDCMLECIARYMPQSFTVAPCEGGLFLWGKLPNADFKRLFPILKEKGVAVVYGSGFFADRSGDEFVRLNFSSPSLDKIKEGIAILGETVK